MKLPGFTSLASFGFVGERKALALLCLGFYVTYFFLLTMLARTELPEYVPMFAGLLAVYVTTFMAVAAEWFWGRWFATGVGYWGVTMAVMAFVTTRSLPPPILVFGIMHGLVSILLMGERMASAFDAKPEWRARWKLDEQGVVRVRKSVTRAASSLPALILFALAPRERSEMFGVHYDFVAVLLTGLAIAALFGLLTSRRTFTVLALGALGLAVVWLGVTTHAALLVPAPLSLTQTHYVDWFGAPWLGAIAGGALVLAALPFARPMLAFVSRRR